MGQLGASIQPGSVSDLWVTRTFR